VVLAVAITRAPSATGDLYSHEPDATGGPVDEDGVSRTNRGGSQCVYRRRAAQHQATRFFEGHVLRLGDGQLGVRHHRGGVPARSGVDDHFVADV
jgi:hypothetical protein